MRKVLRFILITLLWPICLLIGFSWSTAELLFRLGRFSLSCLLYVIFMVIGVPLSLFLILCTILFPEQRFVILDNAKVYGEWVRTVLQSVAGNTSVWR